MSRIGNEPVKITNGVTIDIVSNNVKVKGPKGELNIVLPDQITASIVENEVIVKRAGEEKPIKSLHGTFRKLIANAVEGVTNGYEKKLEIVGVGYRAKMEGNAVVMSLGWNHPVKVVPIEGIELKVPDETTIIITGIDKQMVGQFAAKIKEIRKPEPYKGKGIRYSGEYVKIKSSKSVTK